LARPSAGQLLIRDLLAQHLDLRAEPGGGILRLLELGFALPVDISVGELVGGLGSQRRIPGFTRLALFTVLVAAALCGCNMRAIPGLTTPGFALATPLHRFRRPGPFSSRPAPPAALS
jgi:hypothetical protein